MATQKDVLRIALSLPGARQVPGRFAFSVDNGKKQKEFVWVWMERVDPKKARVANPHVLAVRIADLDDREGMIATGPRQFFTEPHYAGFPAVLVRLPEIGLRELRALLTQAHHAARSR